MFKMSQGRIKIVIKNWDLKEKRNPKSKLYWKKTQLFTD